MKRIITISREFGLSACVNIIMELAQADKEKNL